MHSTANDRGWETAASPDPPSLADCIERLPHLTAAGAGAKIALRSVTGRVGEAVRDTLLDDLSEQGVGSERGRNQIVNAGVTLGCLGSQRGDVTIPMVARPEKVRRDHHGGAPSRDTRVERATDRRLSELHVSRFDDAVRAPLAPLLHEGLMTSVGFLTSGAVIDDHDPKALVRGDGPGRPAEGSRSRHCSADAYPGANRRTRIQSALAEFLTSGD
jgi:hypothetical protein